MTVNNSQEWDVHFFENEDDLLRLLIKMVGDVEIARDLVQETYIRVTQRNNSSTITSPRGYLFTIAANLGRDFLRKRNRRAEIGDEEAQLNNLPSDSVSSERRIYDRQRLALVEEAIEQLPSKTKQAFILRKIEGLETSEIAEHMGVSRNMVEKHLRKALSLTREYLRKKDN